MTLFTVVVWNQTHNISEVFLYLYSVSFSCLFSYFYYECVRIRVYMLYMYKCRLYVLGFPGDLVVKNPPTNAEDAGDVGSTPDLENRLEKEMATYPSILAKKFHRQWSMAGYSP